MADKFMDVQVVISKRGFSSAYLASKFVIQCKDAKFKFRHLKITEGLYRELRVQSLIQ